MSRNNPPGNKANEQSNSNPTVSWTQAVDIQSVEDRVEQLERRLDVLESIFSERVIDKENSHLRAQEKDAREKLAVGETTTVVIEEPPEANGGNAVTHVNGIVTFIDVDSAQKGDTLEVKFTDIDENYAHAIAVP